MKNNNKSFGITFSLFFFLLFLYFFFKHEIINFILISISILFLILGLINSKLLSPLNKAWTKIGILLGHIVSPFVMGIIYFCIVTPIGLILKALKKDILEIKTKNDVKTYWKNKEISKSSMKNQF